MAALADSEVDLPDQLICLLQILLHFLQHDSVELHPQPFNPARNREHLLHPYLHLHRLRVAAQGRHIDGGISFSSNAKVAMWVHWLRRDEMAMGVDVVEQRCCDQVSLEHAHR